jgi:hypothetical protein
MLPDRRAARAKRPPPFGFLKGAALGFLARAGIGNPGISMVESIRMTTLFAGTAGVLTAGGIGRLAAHASLLERGRRVAVVRAARAQAVAGAGLTLIAAIPHGYLPADPLNWIWIGLAGLVTGAVCGALIGLVCGAPAVERLPELLRRVPVLADWARAAQSDPRLRAAAVDARKAGQRALQTEVARAAAPPTRPGLARAPRVDTPSKVSHSEVDTPLPAPVPLGEGLETPLPKDPEKRG